ncbi:MAG: sigma-70 family RNA polymerase sigma factor [Planctomycetaceae bacterium]
MVSNPQPFQSLILQVQSGDQDAARQVYDQYGRQIQIAVRRRMGTGLRKRFDSEDFAQAVWVSIFGNLGQISKLKTPAEFVGYLVRTATYKVIDESRKQTQTLRRDMSRERSIDAICADLLHNDEPSASQIALAHEQWERILQGIPQKYHAVATMRVQQGLPIRQIASRSGYNERTVRRILQRVGDLIRD